jgi:hypothetical protein
MMDLPINALPFYIVYEKPADAPDKFVVRLWYNDVMTQNVWRCDSLEQARAVIRDLHPGAICLQRMVQDDPVIVETWF